MNHAPRSHKDHGQIRSVKMRDATDTIVALLLTWLNYPV
jgi:hypothetical protein